MKRLIVVRHAKSSWNSAALSDFERPLNRRGENDAPEMGRRLHRFGASPNAIITSSAARAVATSKLLAAEIGFPAGQIIADESLYGAGPDRFLAAIAAACRSGDAPREIMIVGHNPGITEFVEFLTGERIGSIPTCGTALIDIAAADWSRIAAGSGKLMEFEFPKKKRRS